MSETESRLLADYPDHRIIGRLPGTEYLVFEHRGDLFSIQGSVVCRMHGSWHPVKSPAELAFDLANAMARRPEVIINSLPQNVQDALKEIVKIESRPLPFFANDNPVELPKEHWHNKTGAPISISFGPMTRHTLNLSTGLCTTIAGVDPSVVESAVKKGAFSQCSRCGGIGANPGAQVCQCCDGWGVVKGE